MSTILEALKRSERERKLNDVPSLADMPAIDEPSPFKWVLLTLLAVVAAALVALLLMQAFTATSPTRSPIVNGTGTQDSGGSLPIVSVISYSEDPAQRFVMIDNRLLREGDFLSTDVRVERIRTDHVLVTVQGESVALKP